MHDCSFSINTQFQLPSPEEPEKAEESDKPDKEPQIIVWGN